VKEDLSVLGQTIGRQLRGVAAFLAPPPSQSSSAVAVDVDVEEEEEEYCRRRTTSDSSAQQALVGIRNDLAEIGGNFKSGLSRLSNLLQFPSNLDERGSEGAEFESEDDEFDKVPGISEEVVDFAKEISTKPGCWTDFPLSIDNDFELSEAQRAHVSAIEHLVPGLTDVKNEVSRCVDDEQFWLIYFILMMPRVNGHDLELLATSKVIATRDRLLLKLQQKREAGSMDSSGDHEAYEEARSRKTENVDEIVDKAETLNIGHREKSEEPSEGTDRISGSGEGEEDISFSDLEVDDNDLSGKPSPNMNVHNRRASNASGSSDWILLNASTRGERQRKDSEGESSDWLAVGDSD
ncbi:PREDICTED: uncharacterized protein LOC104808488, partial [Tarenaya hassleriana]